MTSYYPELNKEGLDINLGDIYWEQMGVDEPLRFNYTFIKSNVTLTANYLGLYFKGYTGDGSQIKLTVDIKIGEQWSWSEPTGGRNQILVASIELSDVLKSGKGWKWIKIKPYTFAADKIYEISFNTINPEEILNLKTDGMVVAGAEQIQVPGIPPDYPYNVYQAKDGYGYAPPDPSWPKFGRLYKYPVAIALSEEEPVPPKKKFPYWIFLFAILIPLLRKK